MISDKFKFKPGKSGDDRFKGGNYTPRSGSSALRFRGLRAHIANAIKQSCYKTDARLYNIANEVQRIVTFGMEPGIETVEGLSKIVDKTIKDAMAVGCDIGVIIKGLFLGAFRASPLVVPEMPKTMRVLVQEILQAIFKYKVDPKQAVEGLLAGIVSIAYEYKINMHEALSTGREDILSSAKAIDAGFAAHMNEALPSLNEN